MALINKLENIAAAIREKTGKSDLLTLEEMATEISEIETGGGSAELPEEAYLITGDCTYRFAFNGWNWFINIYGNKITTEEITNCNNMFRQNNEIISIPFDINIKNNCKDISYVFLNNYELLEVPLFKGELSAPTGNYSGTLTISNLFAGCQNLREIPYDYFHNFGGDAFWEASKNYRGNRDSLFNNCFSLRQAPDISMLKTTDTSAYSILYYGLFNGCYVLDEAINIPVLDTCTFTSNAFMGTFKSCYRTKNIIFETQEDGTPYTANWKSQTIDLYNSVNNSVGYGGCLFDNGVVSTTASTVLKYNSGITADKAAIDDATYQALKNDPDWFAGSARYSRYNHDSAVNTINSLPDTSAYLATAGGTNTIKFLGAAGSATDGGAINTLTEEEIAVATAKGWTVTLV